MFTALILLSGKSFAQDGSGRVNDSTAVGNIRPVMNAIRCANGEITVDGELNEKSWQLAPAADNFVEISPGDNCKAPVVTKVYAVYDDENLYVGFVCYDDDMKSLRANMSDRDHIWSDDYVGIMIDTYRGGKQAYELFCNPKGLQGDAMWTPTDENDSYDLVFKSDAKIYKDRWTLEIAIPFKSIRFPEKKEQTWNVHFIRTRPRQDRTQLSWAVISRDDPSFFGQAGVLKGISNVKNGKNLDLLPYVIGTQNGFKSDIDDPNSPFKNDKIKGDFGIGLKYGFTSNLTGELVYNPDFSQVESDAAQVDVNTSSAIIYPEKRPFFLEGSNIFNSYMPIVYSRTINKPLLAAKLLGKIGQVELGYIGAIDDKTQFILPYDFGSEFALFKDLRSYTNVLRLRRVFKNDSYIGFLGTDREVDKGYNRTLSFDGSLHFMTDYYFNWQVSAMDTKEINDTLLYNNKTTFDNGKYDLAFNGQRFGGIATMLQFELSTRYWYWDVTYFDLPPGTRRDVGYANSADFRQLQLNGGYTWRPEKGFFVRLNPVVNAYVKYNYDGSIKERVLVPNFSVTCRNLIDFNGGFLAVNDEEYKNVMLTGVHRAWLNVNINTSNAVKGGFSVEAGKYIVRFGSPSVGWGFDGGLWLDLRLFGRLLMENTYNYSELSSSYKGEKYYAGYIIRSKSSFQFTKNFFLRIVGQYDTFSGTMQFDPLFSYKWNPFTIFYVGSSNLLTDYGPGEGHPRFVQTGRQFFAKFQYLFGL